MALRQWGNETQATLVRCVCQEASNELPRTFQGVTLCWKAITQTKSGVWCQTFQISKQLSLLTHVPSQLPGGYEKQPSRLPFCYFIGCWRDVWVSFVTLGWIVNCNYTQHDWTGCLGGCFSYFLLGSTFRSPPGGILRVPYMKRVRGVPLGGFLFLLLLIQQQSYPPAYMSQEHPRVRVKR